MSRIPSKIGKYAIQSKVAEGGMGAVFKGLHPTLNRTVILKKLTLKGSQQFIERFRREAQIMMEFKHDNIVSVYDHFKAGDSYYIVLEYIDGPSLGELIRKERYLPEDLALFILKEAALALSYAHKRNVVHRDIKPANLLISKNGEVKLVDFGVAHMGDDEDSDLTTDGMTIGTPSYMAPEQFKDSKGVTNRADIYSLGVMLYEMLTGKKPFPGNFSPEAIAKIQKGKYIRPKKHNPTISAFAERVLRKAMKANPEKRYAQSDRLVAVLESYFRKKNPSGLQSKLESLLAGEPLPKEKKKVSLRQWMLFGMMPVALALVGFFSFKMGWVHEYLLAQSYGRINVSLILPGTHKKSGEIYSRIQFFQDNNDTIPEIQKKPFFYSRRRNEQGAWVFKSLPLYLERGHYRVKVQVEEHLYWYNLYIPERRVQMLDGFTEKGLDMTVDISSETPRPLALAIKTVDSYSGQPLSQGLKIEIQEGNQWVSPGSREWKSGRNYRIRIMKEGYYPKYYHLRVEPFQEVLHLEVALIPEPGKLLLELPENSMTVEINGSKEYLSGSNVGANLPLGKLSGTQNLELTPGFYELKLQYRQAELTRNIEIKRGDVVNLRPIYNEDTKEIVLP